MVEIVTQRMLLRPARASDLGPLHAIFRDPRAMAYWSTPPHESVEQTEEWLAAMIALPPDQGEDFVVEHDGRVIGKAGLFAFPEIGFIFHPASWGRGLATEALSAVIGRGFAVHQLPRIIADVDPRNIRSLGLLGRLGFAETGRAEGTWHVGDQVCDSVYVALANPAGEARPLAGRAPAS